MFWHHLFGTKEKPADISLEPDTQKDALSHLEHSWSKLDLERLWSIYLTDLNRDLKRAKDSTSNAILFTEEEQAQKRAEILSFLRESFLTRMLAELEISWWTRLFSPSQPALLDLSYVGERYADAGKSKKFEKELDLYQRKKRIVEQYEPASLFDNSERATRSFPEMRKVREDFQSFQEQQFKLFNDYIDLVSELPYDEIEEQISQLGKDFEFLGRSREWFREYETMIQEVNSNVPDVDEGQNESLIRLLQNDFLVVMQSRFSIYWRLYELKKFCEERGHHDLTDEIRLFNNQIAELEANDLPAQEREQIFKNFVKSIEAKLTHKAEQKQSSAKKVVTDLLTHDHQARLGEWAEFQREFKRTSDAKDHLDSNDKLDNVAAFNALRPILRQCSEWQHELRVFRSMVKAKRSMDPRSKNSDSELRELQVFLNTIIQRIEAEITTDVAYRSLEQELVKNKEFLVDLIMTRKKLALEKQIRSTKSAETINEIKQEFVKMIRQKRTPDTKGPNVSPLIPSRKKGRF